MPQAFFLETSLPVQQIYVRKFHFYCLYQYFPEPFPVHNVSNRKVLPDCRFLLFVCPELLPGKGNLYWYGKDHLCPHHWSHVLKRRNFLLYLQKSVYQSPECYPVPRSQAYNLRLYLLPVSGRPGFPVLLLIYQESLHLHPNERYLLSAPVYL